MKTDPRIKITYEVTVQFTEQEARALDGLVGYGDEEFIKVFYEKLGQHYLKPHEAGLRSVFKSIREQIGSQLSRVDDLRRVATDTRI